MTPEDDAGAQTGAARTNWTRTLRLLWRTSPRLVMGVVALTMLTAVAPALNVLMIGTAVGAVAAAIGDPSQVATTTALWWAAGLAAVGLFSHVSEVLQQYGEALLRYRMANELNVAIMVKASRLELEDYEDSATYDKLQLASKEAAFRPYQLFSDLVGALTSTFSLIFVALVLFRWSPLVACVMLLAPLPPVAATVLYGQRAWKIENARAEERRRGNYLQFLVTNDRTFKEVRLFGLAGVFISDYRKMVSRFYRVDKRLERGQSIATGAFGLIGILVTGGAIALAMRDSIASGDIGRLAGYMSAVSAVAAASMGLFSRIGMLYEHTLFLGNMFGFLDVPERAKVSGGLPFPQRVRTGIEFRNVSFRYPSNQVEALSHVNLIIPAGQTLALVGENGAGKTTLVKLLTRLYEPTSGEILLDGVPLALYDLTDLRRNMGVLFQDYLQYEASARENIAYGRLARMDDDKALLEAADKAGAQGIIDTFPTGLDTQLGKWFSGGQQLSSGQWQRIALARVLVRSAPVLILDEPTASIDAAAEAEIFSRLTGAASNATTLLIAHRFSTVRTADRIIVLADGEIREQGTHTELLAEEGIYAKLFRLQAKGYADEVLAP